MAWFNRCGTLRPYLALAVPTITVGTNGGTCECAPKKVTVPPPLTTTPAPTTPVPMQNRIPIGPQRLDLMTRERATILENMRPPMPNTGPFRPASWRPSLEGTINANSTAAIIDAMQAAGDTGTSYADPMATPVPLPPTAPEPSRTEVLDALEAVGDIADIPGHESNHDRVSRARARFAQEQLTLTEGAEREMRRRLETAMERDTRRREAQWNSDSDIDEDFPRPGTYRERVYVPRHGDIAVREFLENRKPLAPWPHGIPAPTAEELARSRDCIGEGYGCFNDRDGRWYAEQSPTPCFPICHCLARLLCLIFRSDSRLLVKPQSLPSHI